MLNWRIDFELLYLKKWNLTYQEYADIESVSSQGAQEKN